MKRFAIAIFGLAAFSAHAEIYKSVDADGHVTYSNIPTKGAKRLYIEPLTTVPRPGADLRVDQRTQKKRDETRYKILSEELNAEKGRLEQSSKALSLAGGDEAKAQRFRQDMILHEKNIEALKQEISNLKQ